MRTIKNGTQKDKTVTKERFNKLDTNAGRRESIKNKIIKIVKVNFVCNVENRPFQTMGEDMKAIIWSLICKVIVIIAVLDFTFAIIWLTNNTKFLWLLLLVFCAEFIPTYNVREEKKDD